MRHKKNRSQIEPRRVPGGRQHTPSFEAFNANHCIFQETVFCLFCWCTRVLIHCHCHCQYPVPTAAPTVPQYHSTTSTTALGYYHRAFWVSQYFQKSCFPTMAYCIFCDMSQFTTPPPLPPHPHPLSGAHIRSIPGTLWGCYLGVG